MCELAADIVDASCCVFASVYSFAQANDFDFRLDVLCIGCNWNYIAFHVKS